MSFGKCEKSVPKTWTFEFWVLTERGKCGKRCRLVHRIPFKSPQNSRFTLGLLEAGRKWRIHRYAQTVAGFVGNAVDTAGFVESGKKYTKRGTSEFW